jgi:hypothetical protein
LWASSSAPPAWRLPNGPEFIAEGAVLDVEPCDLAVQVVCAVERRTQLIGGASVQLFDADPVLGEFFDGCGKARGETEKLHRPIAPPDLREQDAMVDIIGRRRRENLINGGRRSPVSALRLRGNRRC